MYFRLFISLYDVQPTKQVAVLSVMFFSRCLQSGIEN